MITGKNESKILTKDISCECKCRIDGNKCNADQWWNNDKCLCECKKRRVGEKDYIWNPAACCHQNGKYSANIMDDSAITCDEMIDADAEAKSNDEETKAFPTNFNEKDLTYKTQNFYILLTFLLITIALLITVSLRLSDKTSSKTKTFITISQHK